MTPDDLGRLEVIKYYLMFWLSPLSRETREECENFARSAPYRWTSGADASSRRGGWTVEILHRGDPRSLLCNFCMESWALGWRAGKNFCRFVQGVPFWDLLAIRSCLEGWSEPIDMGSRDEPLDGLVRWDAEKFKKIRVKNGPFFCPLNLRNNPC